MEEVEIEVDIQERLFLVPVADYLYRQLRQKAAGAGRPVAEFVNDLLVRKLA